MSTEAHIPAHEAPKRSFKARVADNSPINADHMVISIDPMELAPEPRPGQFYMLSAGAWPEPLLKRPLCYLSHTPEGFIRFLYRVKGKGTRLLSAMKPGAELEVIGPLGNHYPKPKRGTTPLIIAGGVGIASVFPFIEAIKGKSILVYGARSKDDMMLAEELEAMSADLLISTDDGTAGIKGTVLDILALPELNDNYTVYACGPKPMIAAAAKWTNNRQMHGYASLEEYMACGIGACMGCVVMTTKGYKRVCKEGPVFKLSELTF